MARQAQHRIGTLAAVVVAAIMTGAASAQIGQPTPSQLARYGWGAAATYAKAKDQPVTSARTSHVGSSTKAELAKYGWGAAATYAKGLGLHHP